MSKIIEEAMAQVAALPEAAQQKIGEELLSHVNKLQSLRVELQKGIRSLDSGNGTVINIKDVIKCARAQYGRQ